MSLPFNTAIVRVKVVLGSDAVLIVDIKEHADVQSPERIVRSSALARGGTDSFWKVSGENIEPKAKSTSKRDQPAPSSPLVSGQSVSFPTFDGTSIRPPPSNVFGPPSEAQTDIKSFKETVRLTVGYRPGRDVAAKLIDALIDGKLKSPIKGRVDVIDLGDGFWLRDSAFIEQDGAYRLATDIEKFAVPVVSLPPEAPTISVGANVILFLDSPQFEDRGTRDFRTEEEVIQSADAWLARISDALKSTDKDRIRVSELRGLLTKYANETVEDNQLNDLFATLTILEQRPALIDVLPDLLKRNTAWVAKVQAATDEEVGRRLEALESRFREEALGKQEAIDALDVALRERQDQLLRLGERERAYRDSLEDIEERVSAKIDSAVAKHVAEIPAETNVKREEWLYLKTEVEHIKDRAKFDIEPIPAEPPTATRIAGVSPREVLPRPQRTVVLQALASAASIDEPRLLLGIAFGGAGLLPVFVGSDADLVALTLAKSISDEGAAIFCDPTLVSLQDVFSPTAASARSLATAIETARAHPDILVPVILCGLTKAPCEFWLPALLDGQRSGYFPSNLGLFATVSSDGIRVPLPYSLLRAIVPIDIGVERARSVDLPQPMTLGMTWPAWPTTPTEESRELRVALQDLLEITDRPTIELLGKISNACQALVDIEAVDLAPIIKEGLDWLAAVREPPPIKHSSIKYFQQFEG